MITSASLVHGISALRELLPAYVPRLPEVGKMTRRAPSPSHVHTTDEKNSKSIITQKFAQQRFPIRLPQRELFFRTIPHHDLITQSKRQNPRRQPKQVRNQIHRRKCSRPLHTANSNSIVPRLGSDPIHLARRIRWQRLRETVKHGLMEFELFGDFISDAGKTTNVVAERSEKFVCDGADVGEIEVEDGG